MGRAFDSTRLASATAALFLAIALAIFPAQLSAQDIILTSPECERYLDPEGFEQEGECGFTRAELNSAGDRLVSRAAGGTVQLWSADGKELGRFGDLPELGVLNGFILDDDRLRLFYANGTQIELSLADGSELRRVTMERTGQGTFRKVGQFHALVQRPGYYAGSSEGFAVLDLRSGRFVRKWQKFWDSWGYHTPWVLGDYATPAGPGKWQEHIVLNDDNLTEIAPPGWSWCHPLRERRWCAQFDAPATGISVFDVDTRKVHKITFAEPIAFPNLLQWAEAGGKSWPLLCAGIDMSAKPVASNYTCRLFDMASGRELFRLQTGGASIAGAISARGRPEIRIAYPDHDQHWQVARIDMGGHASIQKLPDWVNNVAATSLTGEILAGKDEDAELAVLGESGLTERKLPRRFAMHCAPAGGCSIAGSQLIVAVLEGERDEDLPHTNHIRWFKFAIGGR